MFSSRPPLLDNRRDGLVQPRPQPQAQPQPQPQPQPHGSRLLAIALLVLLAPGAARAQAGGADPAPPASAALAPAPDSAPPDQPAPPAPPAPPAEPAAPPAEPAAPPAEPAAPPAGPAPVPSPPTPPSPPPAQPGSPRPGEDPFDAWRVPKETREPKPTPRAWFFRLDAGPAYRRIYDLSSWGAAVSIAADNERPGYALSVGFNFSFGTLLGLGLFEGGVRGGAEARLGIFRAGGGVGLGMMAFSSATIFDGNTFALTVDVFATGTVDVAAFDDRGKSALYVGLRLEGSVACASDAQPLVWGPVLVVGVRL